MKQIFTTLGMRKEDLHFKEAAKRKKIAEQRERALTPLAIDEGTVLFFE